MRNKSALSIPTARQSVAAAGVFTCPANRYFLKMLLLAIFAFAFISCSEDGVTSSYETHPLNWMDEYSPDWHGQAALPGKGESCGACHSIEEPRPIPAELGEQIPPQPTTTTRCYSCHNYPHNADVRQQHPENFSWSTITNCQSCHGVDFAGGRTGASCNECHTQPAGPAACNTCHGMPPTTTRPLGNGNPGAHSAHSRYACTECHNSVNGLDHIDMLPADVAFDDARISTSHDYPAAYENSNCATYCHSNLHQGLPTVEVQWTGGQTLTQCRSCHAVPPTTDFHPTENRCHLCHPNIDPNSNYNDANEILFLPGDTLHVNGVVNALFQ